MNASLTIDKITTWRTYTLKYFSNVFSSDLSQEKDSSEIKKLYTQIGQLKVEIDFLKKAMLKSLQECKCMLETNYEGLFMEFNVL